MILYQLGVMGYEYCYAYFEFWYPIYSLHTLKHYFFNKKYHMGQHHNTIDHEQNIILYDNWVIMQTTIGYSRLLYACIIPILLLAFIAFLACFPEMELQINSLINEDWLAVLIKIPIRYFGLLPLIFSLAFQIITALVLEIIFFASL